MENQENTTINERKCCEKCGQKNSIDNEFCFYCGNVFKNESKKNTVIIEDDTSEKSIEKNNVDSSTLTKENQENTLIVENNFCEKCGQNNNTNNKFCINCGNKFSQENQQKSNLTEEIKEEKKSFTKKKIFTTILIIIATLPLWWGGIIGIFIAISIIAYYLLHEEPKNTDKTQNHIVNDDIICERCEFKNNINNKFCLNCGNLLIQETNIESKEHTEKNIVIGGIETLFRTIGTLIWSGIIITLILFGTCVIGIFIG